VAEIRPFFAWVDDAAVWGPEYARDDVDVYALTLSQAEGEFARAEVVLRNARDGLGLLRPGQKRRAFISTSVNGSAPVLLFDGRLVGAPRELADVELVAELIARPLDWEQRQEAYLDTLKVLPWYDPAFVPLERQDEPAEVLEGYGAYLHWHRATHALTVSPVLSGSATLDLGSECASVFAEVSDPPVRRVELSASVEWEQQAKGEMDLTAEVVAAFPYKTPATLTPAEFETSWPSQGQQVGDNTGYTVTKSTLEPISDKSRLPFSSFKFTVRKSEIETIDPAIDDDVEEREYDQELPVSWYDCALSVKAVYRQARREVVRCVLSADTQAVFLDEGPDADQPEPMPLAIETVTRDNTTPDWREATQYAAGDYVLAQGERWQTQTAHRSGYAFSEDRDRGLWTQAESKVAPLGTRRRASYFLTERGRQSVEHLLLRGAARLASASRCVLVRAEAPLELCLFLTCDHLARVASPSLPGGEVTGKVVSYSLVLSGDGTRLAQLTLACSVGRGSAAASPTPTQRQVGAVVYNDYAAQRPREPVDAYRMNKAQLLRPVSVVNDVRTQYQALPAALAAAAAGEEREAVEAALEDKPTGIVFTFKSLEAYDLLTHEITVTAAPVALPKQIDLEAGA